MMWNYRGYGYSEGSPTTGLIEKDAQCLVDYMKDEMKITNIGVHGQSLGGMIAVHIS